MRGASTRIKCRSWEGSNSHCEEWEASGLTTRPRGLTSRNPPDGLSGVDGEAGDELELREVVVVVVGGGAESGELTGRNETKRCLLI